MEEERNVEKILSAADDSVDLINNIDDHVSEDEEQGDINVRVQRNVDHLEVILAYEEVNEDDSDKSSYEDAIEAGADYIAAND
tara:strand:- start:6999 stop:7247 length:249 start_codon:yes stop_codon:yes gene_type:complete